MVVYYEGNASQIDVAYHLLVVPCAVGVVPCVAGPITS